MSKVGLISLGCPKNRVDSEVLLGHLHKEGHALVSDIQEAEIIVVNTCSFIEDSKQESIDAILEAAELKKQGRCSQLIVTGCLAERYPDEIRSTLKEVDAVLGTNQLTQIGEAAAGVPVAPPDTFGRSDADLYLYDHQTPRMLSTPAHSAYVKISEGCDHTCAFCVIPKIRGSFRSRKPDSIVQEARNLAAGGVKEINLVSQDTTSYGLDLGLRDGVAALLERLSEVQGIRWIRLFYVYPNLVRNRLLDVLGAHDSLCRYIDVPLQHSSAPVLQAMRRGGDRKTLSNLVARIRSRIPDVTLRTTMIVGFPGEQERDFEDLKDFCREMEFDRLGVFTYSDEENTTAFDLEAKVPRSIAEERKAELMSLQEAITVRKNKALVGRTFPLLVEGISTESEYLMEGRLQSQAPEIDGVCLVNDSRIDGVEAGEFRTVRITRSLGHDLLGTIVG